MWKSTYMSVFIQKYSSENFAFLIQGNFELYILESRIIGGVGIIRGFGIVIIINNRGVGQGWKISVGGFLVLNVKLITTVFSFFSTNGHKSPIQFNTRKLRNDGI